MSLAKQVRSMWIALLIGLALGAPSAWAKPPDASRGRTGTVVNPQRRSFLSIGCEGAYDEPKYKRLDKICNDCSVFVKDSAVYSNCTGDCFTTQQFLDCVDLMQEEDYLPEFTTWIQQLRAME